MEIDHKVENGIINIAIKGRLDAATSPAAEESINFSSLEYLSSGGLRVILGASKEIRRREGKVALCCLNQYVNEIFEVSGFSAMIPIKDTVAEGLKELA
jgi:anti-anti-sigma factor